MLPLLAPLNQKHQPELVTSLPSSALQVQDSPVRAPHGQRAVSMETKLQRVE